MQKIIGISSRVVIVYAFSLALMNKDETKFDQEKNKINYR